MSLKLYDIAIPNDVLVQTSLTALALGPQGAESIFQLVKRGDMLCIKLRKINFAMLTNRVIGYQINAQLWFL